MHRCILMKLDHNHSVPDPPHNTDDIYKVIGSKVKVKQRRNSTAGEPLKRFQPKLTQTFPTLGPRNDLIMKVMDSKVKVTETFSHRDIPINVSHRQLRLIPSSTAVLVQY